MLFCCIGTADQPWEVLGLCKDVPRGNLTILYVCGYFFLEAGNDLKRALFALVMANL